ncbi:protein aveugle-like [Pollicipes pollicipes]|uniref:protein aveugle-like n=1 Tax=Pollicipes pollicipes TaxID=41117 RepID=UPI001884AAA0|nr:protein aveugle-like [Pollicipes pollicipes]XP_037088635.1 protein aveugle-like [Pollicipes pollicipes]XP_037088636.1 protein aveugle-like [Pollicipes pollicipes]
MTRASAPPRPVYLWSVADVQKWFRRHLSEYHTSYSEHFVQHDITGVALVRLTRPQLQNMGIGDPRHREDIYREIAKLRLKSDLLEIRNVYTNVKGDAVLV